MIRWRIALLSYNRSQKKIHIFVHDSYLLLNCWSYQCLSLIFSAKISTQFLSLVTQAAAPLTLPSCRWASAPPVAPWFSIAITKWQQVSRGYPWLSTSTGHSLFLYCLTHVESCWREFSEIILDLFCSSTHLRSHLRHFCRFISAHNMTALQQKTLCDARSVWENQQDRGQLGHCSAIHSCLCITGLVPQGEPQIPWKIQHHFQLIPTCQSVFVNFPPVAKEKKHEAILNKNWPNPRQTSSTPILHQIYPLNNSVDQWNTGCSHGFCHQFSWPMICPEPHFFGHLRRFPPGCSGQIMTIMIEEQPSKSNSVIQFPK